MFRFMIRIMQTVNISTIMYQLNNLNILMLHDLIQYILHNIF